MKFTIESNALAKVASDLVKVIPAKTALPILTNFLVETKGELLRLTANDQEVAMRGIVKPDSIETQGKVCIPAKILLDLLGTLPDGPVTFELKEQPGQAVMAITWKNGSSTVPVFDEKDYPSVTVPKKDDPAFATVSEVIADGINKTLFATSSDSTKPTLCGLFFDLAPEGSSIVASDSRKLVCYDFKSEGLKEAASFILPAKAAQVIKGILPKETPVKVVFNDKVVRFFFGNMDLSTRTVTGKFPAYKTIIPTDNQNVMQVNREDLMNTFKRMAVLADRKAVIARTSVSKKGVQINTEDLGMKTKGSEVVPASYEGQDINLALNIPNMVDTLSKIYSETVEIRLKDEKKAMLIQPCADDRAKEPYKAIVMPYFMR